MTLTSGGRGSIRGSISRSCVSATCSVGLMVTMTACSRGKSSRRPSRHQVRSENSGLYNALMSNQVDICCFFLSIFMIDIWKLLFPKPSLLGLAMTQIELEKIADSFDKDHSGMIDLNAILGVLKGSSRRRARPLAQETMTDSDKIENEVNLTFKTKELSCHFPIRQSIIIILLL